MNPDRKKIEDMPFVHFGWMAYELIDSDGPVTGRGGTRECFKDGKLCYGALL
jgi:hypothetical protein